jgi:hypothetical protein
VRVEQKRVFQASLAAIAVWIILYACIAPPFGGVDVFIFKDAGANLALNHRFESIPAPFFDGDPAPRFFSWYTPLYPLSYGIWGSVFGVGPYANAYFELALAAVALGFTLALALPFTQRSALRRWLLVGAVMTVPAGGVFYAADRPEILGYALSLALLIAWTRSASFRHSAVGIGASSLVFLAHPFAGIMMLIVTGYLTLTEPRPAGAADGPGLRLRTALAGLAVFLAVLGVCGLTLFAIDPQALGRFSHHALGSSSGAGVIRNIGSFGDLIPFYATQWRHAFLGSSIASLTMAGSLVVCAAVLLLFAIPLLMGAKDRPARVRDGLFACFLFVLILIPVLMFPRQNNYYSFTRALVPVVILASGSNAAAFLRTRDVPAILLMIGWLCCLPSLIVDVTTRTENLDSYRQAALGRPLLAGIATEDLVAASPALYYLLKPVHPKLVGIDYLDAGNSAAVNALVVGHAALPSGERRAPVKDDLQTFRWRAVSDESEPVLVSIFGRQLMRSQWGWNFDVYIRAADASAALSADPGTWPRTSQTRQDPAPVQRIASLRR